MTKKLTLDTLSKILREEKANHTFEKAVDLIDKGLTVKHLKSGLEYQVNRITSSGIELRVPEGNEKFIVDTATFVEEYDLPNASKKKGTKSKPKKGTKNEE